MLERSVGEPQDAETRECARCGEQKAVTGLWVHDTEKDRWFCGECIEYILDKGH